MWKTVFFYWIEAFSFLGRRTCERKAPLIYACGISHRSNLGWVSRRLDAAFRGSDCASNALPPIPTSQCGQTTKAKHVCWISQVCKRVVGTAATRTASNAATATNPSVRRINMRNWAPFVCYHWNARMQIHSPNNEAVPLPSIPKPYVRLMDCL